MKITHDIDVLKQLFENLSDTGKQQFLSEITNSKATIQKVIQPREVKTCPHCQSTHFVKNGKTNSNQRYLCKACFLKISNLNQNHYYKKLIKQHHHLQHPSHIGFCSYMVVNMVNNVQN